MHEHVAGDEVVHVRDRQVVHLLVADVDDRDDLVPPDVRGREELEVAGVEYLGEQRERRPLRRARPDVPVVVGGLPRRLRHRAPRAIALGLEDLAPERGRDGVEVGMPAPPLERDEDALDGVLFAEDADVGREPPDGLGMAHLDLPGRKAAPVVQGGPVPEL